MRMGMVAASKLGARVFRNNVALAWAGKVFKVTRPERIAVGPGDVVIRGARPIHAGLMKGSGDLIGLVPLKIEQHHVGTVIGVFASIETKSADGKPTDEQENWRKQINLLGGIAGIARCDDDVLQILSRLSGPRAAE